MPDLYPKFDMPDLVEEVEDTSIAYPKSWLFDFDTGDFVLDGAGNVVEADGLTAWAQWCVKAVLTQRLAFVVYNWDYGVDIENVMKQPTRAVTEAELEKEITEALMTDPRTAEVKNFTFEWSGDELTVSFIIVNAAGVPAEIRVGVGYREVMREFSISKVEQTISDWLRGELVNVEPTENGELVIKSVAQPTFTRDSIAYKSDGSQVAVNVPRSEAGKFGQGILIEEGTTNLLPSNDAQGKTRFSSNDKRYSSNTLETSFGLNDLYSLKSDQLVFTTNRGFYSPFYPTVAGNVYTFSYYVYNATSTSHNFIARLIFYDGSGNLVRIFYSNSVPVPAQQWKRISVTATAPSDSTQCRVVGWESGTTSQVGDVYYFDNFQLEQKEYATSWTVGTRQPEILEIPTNIVTPTVGTVSVWVNVNDASKRQVGVYPTIFCADVAGSGKAIWLFHRSGTAQWRFQFKNESGVGETIEVDDSITPNGWHHFAISWSANKMALYIDGIKRGEQPNPPLPASFIEVYIGCWGTGANQIDTVLDDFVLYNRQLSDNEVQAIYNSNQPAPITENTTYALRFDGGLNFGRGGYYISPEYDLSTVGNYVKHRVYWQEDADKEECLVYAKLDNQSDWTQLTNGGSLPIVEGQDLTGRKIQFKVKLLDLV